MNLRNSGASTGFEPITSAMPVQCSNQLSYEVTQMGAGHFVALDSCFPVKGMFDFKHRTSYTLLSYKKEGLQGNGAKVVGLRFRNVV